MLSKNLPKHWKQRWFSTQLQTDRVQRKVISINIGKGTLLLQCNKLKIFQKSLNIVFRFRNFKLNDSAMMIYHLLAVSFFNWFPKQLYGSFFQCCDISQDSCHLLMAPITKNFKHQQKLGELGWFHASSFQKKRNFHLQKISVENLWKNRKN